MVDVVYEWVLEDGVHRDQAHVELQPVAAGSIEDILQRTQEIAAWHEQWDGITIVLEGGCPVFLPTVRVGKGESGGLLYSPAVGAIKRVECTEDYSQYVGDTLVDGEWKRATIVIGQDAYVAVLPEPPEEGFQYWPGHRIWPQGQA